MKLLPFVPFMVLCTSCASVTSTTGESGVSMGDSYDSVLQTLKSKNKITNEIKDVGIRAEGFLPLTKDCRIKYFLFQGKDGLQSVRYDPAPNLSVSNNCQ